MQIKPQTPSKFEQESIQEAFVSLEYFERTGLHVRLDEVKQWAKEIKTNRNAQLPLCHM
jgi:uncharacterized protein YdeI (YjbR/CyaY-like superfamily)